MKLIILGTLSLIFVLGWYSWSIGRLRLMHTWSSKSNVIAISQDGLLLATPAGPFQKREIEDLTLTSSTTVKLHTFPDGEIVRTLDAFCVTKLAFSPDNSLIAAGTGFGEIFIWRINDGQLLHSLRATTIEPRMMPIVNTLIFSRDGRTLITGVGERVDAWRVADGQLLYSLSPGYNGALSPDGQILAVDYRVTQITLYRLSDGTRLRQLELNGHPRFSSDGKILAISHSTSYEDSWQKVLLYRLEDDTLLGTLYHF